jgi:hypothetical protein
MANERSFVVADHFDRDLYTSSQTRERALNAAIVEAEISQSFDKYLAIFDAFYADDIEVSSESADEPIRGKARVRSLLANFLYPIHMMAEVGGLVVTIRQTTPQPIRPTDSVDFKARHTRTVPRRRRKSLDTLRQNPLDSIR